MMLDLRFKYLNILEDLIQHSFTAPIEIWAYGSRVNGDNHEASDLDLVILTADLISVDTEELQKFKVKLQKSNIPILIQVLDWANIPESFRCNILKNHEVIYSSLSK